MSLTVLKKKLKLWEKLIPNLKLDRRVRSKIFFDYCTYFYALKKNIINIRMQIGTNREVDWGFIGSERTELIEGSHIFLYAKDKTSSFL